MSSSRVVQSICMPCRHSATPMCPVLARIHAGVPYVIENVPGAPLRGAFTLCGLSFGLGVKRHRLFESNVFMMVPPCGDHRGDWLLVFGHTVLSRGHVVGKAKGGGNTIRREHVGTDRGREAMGIDWMTRDELSQAIPRRTRSSLVPACSSTWHRRRQREPVPLLA